MAAYLLTWNPKNWGWAELPTIARNVADGLPVEQRWSCGNSRSIPVGSRVFLLRQGVEPKGIVASGWVTKSPFAAPHWDTKRAASGEQAHFIMFTADALLNPEVSAPLDLRAYTAGPLSEVQVDAPASGNSIPDPVAIALSESWSKHLGIDDQPLGKGDPELGAMEGELRRRFVSHRARERALREAKLAEARSKAPDGRIRCVAFAVRCRAVTSTSRQSMAIQALVSHMCITCARLPKPLYHLPCTFTLQEKADRVRHHLAQRPPFTPEQMQKLLRHIYKLPKDKTVKWPKLE